MRKTLALLIFACLSLTLSAQDELMDILEEEVASQKAETDYTKATFKGIRVINGHSVEMPAKKELRFIIGHRFGSFGSFDEGWRRMFGIDDAGIRFGIEYGINDWVSVGMGRGSFEGMWDAFVRGKVLRQTDGPKKIPLSITIKSSVAITSNQLSNEEQSVTDISHRLSYANQVVIGRKFHRAFSLQIMPTYVHRNLIDQDSTDRNDTYYIGAAARFLVSGSVALNVEYFQPLPIEIGGVRTPGALGFGIDIETGGHVFQIMITNSGGMIDQLYLTENKGYSWADNFRLGFNVNRVFNLGGKKKKKEKL